MNALTLETIRRSLEGVVPSILATCDREGAPNVSLISQVHYVGPGRVALSYQFFNKTRRNILETRAARAIVVDPVTRAQYELDLDYLETQTEGPLFEAMKAKLAGIASHTGMAEVFRLLGADIFQVRSVRQLLEPKRATPSTAEQLLSAARCSIDELSKAGDLDELLGTALSCLKNHFGFERAMILLTEATACRLFVVDSHGYESSGIGSEIAVGDGVIGVAAREGVPIRIGHMTSEYRYGDAIRQSSERTGASIDISREIPYPGLTSPQSQIAIPIMTQGKCIGVLFSESPEPLRFWYEEEDALAILATLLGSFISRLQHQEEVEHRSDFELREVDRDRTITVRHYPFDNSIFLDHDYLIKGVAGAIFWKLVSEHAENGRTEFTNRELRLDAGLGLPEFMENLEARLLLLYRRLEERDSCIRLEKQGRGRFRLILDCHLVLQDMTQATEPLSAG